MKVKSSAILSIALIFLMSFSIRAQETELKVVDEVVAQVNDSVITLSSLKREMKVLVEALVREGKTKEQAEKEVENRIGELIANLINEELIVQKAKEIGIDSEVEAEINRRFLSMMRENNIRSLEKLFEVMRGENIDPDEIRLIWRKQLTREYVLYRDVDQKVYWGWTSKEIRDYYEKNKPKFTRPETITISEIFLNFAGRVESAVREKAKKLVEELRAGADFEKVAIENSDRSDVRQSKGKIGTLKVAELDQVFAVPLKNVKVGGITDPIEVEGGIEILRVDARTEASSESVFDEAEVRKAMTVERLPDERKKYLLSLRQESYIKINETYRPLVAPILFTEERKSEK